MATSASPPWNSMPQCKDAAELRAWSNLLGCLYFSPIPFLRRSHLGMFSRLIRTALKSCGPEKSQQKGLGIPSYLLDLWRSHGFPSGVLPLSSQNRDQVLLAVLGTLPNHLINGNSSRAPHHPLSTQNLCSVFLHILSLSLHNTLLRHEIGIPITLLDR